MGILEITNLRDDDGWTFETSALENLCGGTDLHYRLSWWNQIILFRQLSVYIMFTYHMKCVSANVCLKPQAKSLRPSRKEFVTISEKVSGIYIEKLHKQ